MNNQKFIKTLNIILLVVIIIFAVNFAMNKYRENKENIFRNDCQTFAEIIQSKTGNNDNYLVEVKEYNNGNHDTIHLMFNIFNYGEAKLKDYESQVYAIVEDEFNKYEFDNDGYNKMHIDIFDSEKNGTELSGHGVSYKDISK